MRLLRDAPGPMQFGLIETGTCGTDCWLAEGCVEATDGISLCHDSAPSGLTLTTVTNPGDVVESETTLVSDLIDRDTNKPFTEDDWNTFY